MLFIIQSSRLKGKQEQSLSVSKAAGSKLKAQQVLLKRAVCWVSRALYNHDVLVCYAIYMSKAFSLVWKTITALVRILFMTVHFGLKRIGDVADAGPEEQPQGRQCLCC